MQKKDFVQRAAIQFLVHVGFDLDKAINYGERLWKRLSERGYGAPTKSSPRVSVDWHKKLSAYQREWFDLFWKAFRHKHGRNEAAMVWHRMGELSQSEYQHIVKAAEAEALRPRDHGIARKMAQGWLSERRFDDHTPLTEPSKDDAIALELRELKGDLEHFKRLQKLKPNDAQAEQIYRIQTKIEDLRGNRS